MRSFAIALLLLAVLLGGVIRNYFFINETAEELLTRIDALPSVDSDDCLPRVKELADYWEERTELVSLSVCYPSIDRVSEQIALTIACVECQDVYSYCSAVALLRDTVTDLRRLERFAVGNLL